MVGAILSVCFVRFVTVGLAGRSGRRKGAQMPSIADELATDLNTMDSRSALSRRYGLEVESFELINEVYQRMAMESFAMNRHMNAIAGRLSLRPPQRQSLEILDRVMDIAHPAKNADTDAMLEIIRSEYPTLTATYGGKPWKYALIPHDQLASNMTLEGFASRFGFEGWAV